MTAKILIGADIVPTESNYSYFKNGDSDCLIGKEIKEIINVADFTIFNLEVPLADKKNPIDLIRIRRADNKYSLQDIDIEIKEYNNLKEIQN